MHKLRSTLIQLFFITGFCAGCAQSSIRSKVASSLWLDLAQQGSASTLGQLEERCQKGSVRDCPIVQSFTSKTKRNLPILQGATGADSVIFSAMAPKEIQYKFFIVGWGDKKVILPGQALQTRFSTETASLWNIRFQGLKKSQDYRLFVVNENGELADWRNFKTFAGDEKQIRFVFGSCMDDFFQKEQLEVWQATASLKPDLYIMGGDNVYADKKDGKNRPIQSAEELWRRYAEARETFQIFRFENLTPVYAVWDDHDYGINSGDRTFPLRESARTIFNHFFPAPHGFAKVSGGPGVSKLIPLGAHRFILLDNRYWRSAAAGDFKSGEIYFGQEQLQWLRESLRGSGDFFWIVGGGQFLGYPHPFESYQNHYPKEHNEFVQILKGAKAPFVLLSGDRHMTEVMEIEKSLFGFQTFEFTSSPMFAKTYPGSLKEVHNPRRMRGLAADGTFNFMFFQAEARKHLGLVQMESFNQKGASLFQHFFRVQR